MDPFLWHSFSSPILPQLAGALVIILVVLWMGHVWIGNASLADVGFCVGFALVVTVCAVIGEGSLWRRSLVAVMGNMYAGRLGWHLLTHRVWGKVEDPRYRHLRAKLGPWGPVGFLGYFLLQVPACLFFASLLCWVMANPESDVRGWDLLGLGVFVLALSGETVADRQLEQFRAIPENRGKVLDQGLWRYSRHPNYFFETLLWCAYVPLAIGLPGVWVSIFWPVLMMVFLLWVTGVPWAEAQALMTRGEAYRRYQLTTNTFFPWKPRRMSTNQEGTV